MAYGGINYGKTIDVLTDIGKQGATIWAADRAAKSAQATRDAESAQWLATQQVDLFKTQFQSSDSVMSDLNKEIFAGNFDIDPKKHEANYNIYKQQWKRRSDAFKQWANALGQPTYDSETDIIAVVDDIFAKTIEITDNPRKYLKFGDTKGKWAEAVSRFSPGVDLDLVEIVWNNRYDALTEGAPEAGGWIPGAGATGKMDYKTDIYSPPGSDFEYTPEKVEWGGPWWLDKAANWWKDLSVRTDIRDIEAKQRFGETFLESTESREIRRGEREAPPERLDLSQYEEAAQRRDSANNLLASIGNTLISAPQASGGFPVDRTGRAGVIARQGAEQIDPLMGQQGLISGFLSQDPEEDGLPDISRQAMRFLERLSAMIQEYGPEEAFKLMSGQFKDLNKADKAKIEEYLENR